MYREEPEVPVKAEHKVTMSYEKVEEETTEDIPEYTQTKNPRNEKLRNFRPYVTLERSFGGFNAINIHDKNGGVVVVPVSNENVIQLRESDPQYLIQDLAVFITAAMTPSAIFETDEFSDMIDSNHISGMDESNTLFLTGGNGDYIFAYRIWSYLFDELMEIYETLNAQEEGIFESTVPLITCALFNQQVLGLDQYRDAYSEIIHDTSEEAHNRKKFISFMVSAADKHRNLEPIQVSDIDDFINGYQDNAVISHLVSSNYEESEESDENGSSPLNTESEVSTMPPFPEYKEDNDGRGNTGEIIGNAGGRIPDVDENRSEERGVNEGSGSGSSGVVQNPYAGELKEEKAEESSEVQDVYRHREIVEQLRAVEETQEEEKEDSLSMVIPVRRG